MYLDVKQLGGGFGELVLAVTVNHPKKDELKLIADKFQEIEQSFEQIPESDIHYASLKQAIDFLRADIETFSKGAEFDTLIKTVQDKVMERSLTNREMRRHFGKGDTTKPVSLQDITKRLDLMTRHLDRARARFQKEKEGTRQSGHVKSSVVRSVLTIQSSSFLEKAERIAQDIARFEVIDKSARKTYKKDLQDIILEAEKAGVLDDDIREKVASSLALLDTKGGRNSGIKSSQVTSKNEVSITPIGPKPKEVPEYNKAAVLYLTSFMTSVGGIFATKTGSKSLGDGPFRKNALSPMIRHFNYLLERGDIDARSFSWSEVVTKGFDNKDNGGRVLIQHAKKYTTVMSLAENLETLSDIIELSAKDLKITCEELNAGLARFLKSNKIPL